MSTTTPAFAAANFVANRHLALSAVTIISQQIQHAASSPPTRPRRRVELYHSNANNREPPQEEDAIFSVVDKVTQVLSTPTPGINSLALGYPLALLASTAFLPLTTSIVSTGFFVAYASLGRAVVVEPESEDTNLVDLAAFLGAIASAGILSPSGFSDGNGMPITLLTGSSLVGVSGIALIGLAVASILSSQTEPEEEISAASFNKKLMDRWDERFRQQDGEE